MFDFLFNWLTRDSSPVVGKVEKHHKNLQVLEVRRGKGTVFIDCPEPCAYNPGDSVRIRFARTANNALPMWRLED